MYDVIIIGAGVVGCAAARELSRYRLRTLVLEKEEDVCAGTSKANSGLVHAGFDAAPGSLKARMNVQGSRMMPSLCQELDVPFQQTGALVVAKNEAEKAVLERLLEQGRENGVEGLSIVEGQNLRRLEPNLAEGVTAALYAETAGLVCPFKLTIAMAENANVNGVEFAFQTQVTDIVAKRDEKGAYYEIRGEAYPFFAKDPQPERVVYETRVVINCAGVYSDELHNMVSEKKYHITPRRGEYCLLDKAAGGHVSRTVFAVPGTFGKGILVTPTVHGNLLLGPTAEAIRDKEGVCTTAEGIARVLESVAKTVGNIPTRQVITSFAGLRATEDGKDFIIEEAPDAPGFLDAVGIDSPGLSSAPAIGLRLADMVAGILQPAKNQDFIAARKDIIHLRDLSEKQQKRLIQAKPEYGTVVCRCESITEGEILEAIYRPLGAKSLDGIKRRTRAGMGRCQSGFCSPRVVELLARAYHVSPLLITKSGRGTGLLVGRDKEVRP